MGTVKNSIDIFSINPEKIKMALIGWDKCSVWKSIIDWMYKLMTIKTISHEDKSVKANLLNIYKINAAIITSL